MEGKSNIYAKDGLAFSLQSIIIPTRRSCLLLSKPLLHPNVSILEEIIKLFPDLTIKNLFVYRNPELSNKCHTAVTHFASILNTQPFSYGLSGKFISESALNALFLCLRYDNFKINIQDSQILFNFLAGCLNNKRDSMMAKKYGAVLLQIVSKNISTIQSESKNIIDTSHFLCIQYKMLIILLDLIQNTATLNEIISNCYELIEQSIRHLLNKTYEYPLGKDEAWIEGIQRYVKVATCVNKPLFTIISLSKSNVQPKFSLRYLCLYCLYRAVTLMTSKKIDNIKKSLVDLMELILKSLLDAYNTKYHMNTELLLNETLTFFLILKSIISCISKPSEVLNKLDNNKLLNSLITSYVNTILKYKLIAITFDTISYKHAYDYIAVLFIFLQEVNRIRDKLKHTLKNQIFFGEFIGKLIKKLDEVDEEVMVDYIIEYLFEDNVISKQKAECIVNLLTTKSVHFTSPYNLDNILHEPIVRNKRIQIMLKKVIEDDKLWAETILKHLIDLVKTKSDEEAIVFGLYKLIHCACSGLIYTNNSFNSLIFDKELNDINFDIYSTNTQRGETKAIRGFIDIKGINTLISLLKDNLISNSKVTIMTENLILKLTEIPAISQQLISNSLIIVDFLNCPKRDVALKLLSKLMRMAKFSSEDNNIEILNTENYLPIALTRHLTLKFNEKEELGKLIPFMDLIVKFLEEEHGAYSVNRRQVLLSTYFNIKTVFTELRENKNSPFINEAIKNFLKLICNLQLHNKTVAKSICNYKALKIEELSKFLKLLIKDVTLLAQYRKYLQTQM